MEKYKDTNNKKIYPLPTKKKTILWFIIAGYTMKKFYSEFLIWHQNKTVHACFVFEVDIFLDKFVTRLEVRGHEVRIRFTHNGLLA